MDPEPTCEIESDDLSTGPEVLDPDGDVLLSIDDLVRDINITFIASSKVLSLASPVFSAMFSKNFKEGSQVMRGECPTINLEDDSQAMESILRILHYQTRDIALSMEPKNISAMAIHSDKYDCNKALRPWIEHWCNNYGEFSTSEDFGHLLLAAYLFRSSSFPKIVVHVAKQLKLDFISSWREHEVLSRLPETITAQLSDLIIRTLRSIRGLLEATEEHLRPKITIYKMNWYLCTLCGRNHPETAKKCHSCNNSDLFPRLCTSDSRVADYFATLRRCELWPTTKAFDKCSLMEITSRLQSAEIYHQHQCAGRDVCPLIANINLLSDLARRQVRDMKGFVLK